MHLMSMMQECSVLDEDPINMSDHLPVCAGFVCDLNNLSPADGTNKRSSTAFKPNWSKLSKQEIQAQYTSMVEDHLSSLSPLAQDVLISTPSLIDQHLKEITEILINTAKASIPAKRFSFHLKTYNYKWDHSLKEAHSNLS